MQECVLSTDRRSVRTRRALRQALAKEIHDRFFAGYAGVTLPHCRSDCRSSVV